MRSWSLKAKVGAYAALLTMIALAIASAVVLPLFRVHQVNRLDKELAENAAELHRDLTHFQGAPVNPRLPIRASLIPLALRERYLVVYGPEGQIIYRSPNLQEAELIPREEGIETITLLERECRIGTFHRGPYLILVATSLDPIKNFGRQLRKGFLWAVPISGLIVFGGSLLLVGAAFRPVAKLTAAAERISTSNPEERLPMPPNHDEIARLTEVLNQSFDRLQRSFEISQRFSADASHQLKTPVAILRNGLSALRDCDYLQPQEQEDVKVLLQQTRRLTTLIDDLLLLAQADAGLLHLDRETLDLAPLVEASLDDLSALVEECDVALEKSLVAPLLASGDSRRVSLVLQSLTENAAKYTPAGGTIRFTTTRSDQDVLVRIANTGKNIEGSEREKIFERFHRGSSTGEAVRGHGLGLNIARELARAHGGDLSLIPSDNGWTEFEFRLPADDPNGRTEKRRSS